MLVRFAAEWSTSTNSGLGWVLVLDWSRTWRTVEEGCLTNKEMEIARGEWQGWVRGRNVTGFTWDDGLREERERKRTVSISPHQ